ncbi:MAG TPA: hypothetical protein V6C57_16265 [Coleofasciculaceae cyanobacterium]
MMETQDLTKLEARIKELSHGLQQLSNDDDLAELIRIIHHPGWTTPAEYLFVSGLVDALIIKTKTLGNLKHTLIAGSRLVGKQAVGKPR